MAIPQVYELATNSEFRLLAGFTSPPRAGVITALEASGQVRVAMDDADGADVLAWPLNGFAYPVGALVYVVFASDSPESGIVVGSKGSMPTLAADWDLGEDRRLRAEAIRARDGEGLRLEEDSGNLGIFVADSGQVGVGTSDPDGFEVDLPVTETAQARNNVRLGIRGGTPRMILEEVTSGVQWQIDNHNGVFRYFTPGNVALALTTAGRIGSGAAVGTTPQGKLHLHDGVGGMILATVTGINSTTPVVIIANGAGDVVRGWAGQVIATDGTLATAGTVTLLTPDVVDLAVGTLTLRLEILSNGQLQVKRQSGSGTGTVALLGVWL